MPSSSHNRAVTDFNYVKKRPYTGHRIQMRKIAPFRADLGTLRALQPQQSNEQENPLQSHLHEPRTGL
jgi:hypothetical protein